MYALVHWLCTRMIYSAMPSYHDSLPSPDLLSSWQTREALLRQSAQPQQERKKKHFLSVFLCIPYRGRKELWNEWVSFLMAVWGWGSCSFAFWFQCLSTGTCNFPSCSIKLRTYLCQCLIIPLSSGAAEEDWVSTEASCCGLFRLRQSCHPHTMAHRTASAASSLGKAFWLCWDWVLRNNLTPFPQALCRDDAGECRVQPFHALPVSGCTHRDASTQVMKGQLMSCIQNSNWITRKQNNTNQFDTLTCWFQNHFLFLYITKIFQ